MVDARTRTFAFAMLGGLAACGTGGDQPPDFSVRGVGVVVSSSAPFALKADLPSRIESTVDAALGYWGGDWRLLGGTTITLEGERYVPCARMSGTIGCYDGNIRVSTQDAGSNYSCVEQTVLVHEIGHAVIGDPDHLDPRWMDFSEVTQELAGRIGYTNDGEVPCQLWASVWQHPPDR
jgi:hypothetical protein